ncbi:phage portal protein [Marinifilum sp. JC120]|nr:phage portal protein [Marinifilum sp. JC120]
MNLMDIFRGRSEVPQEAVQESERKTKRFGRGKNIMPHGLRRGFGSATGNFESANVDRLNSGWTTEPISALLLVERNWRILCARGRECSHNTAHGKKFLKLVKKNVVGPAGVQVTPTVKGPDGKADKIAREALAAAWKDWGKNPDVTGIHTWRSFQGLAMETVGRDGEVFARKLKGRKYGKYRFQLQFIDPARCPSDYREKLSNGNYVRAGIEFTSYGKPVAYYFRIDADDLYSGVIHNSNNYERIPADEIIHLFVPEMINQPRGLSWMGTALQRLRQLNKYEEAAIINANIGASKMGFFEADPEYVDVDADDDEELEEDFPLDAEPGTFDTLPVGWKFNKWDPQYPQGEFEGFYKTILHVVAAGLGVSYSSLSGDLSKVNYSSIRAGMLDERDLWMELQSWFIEKLVQPVFEEWVSVAVLAQAVTIGLNPLRVERIDQYMQARYQGRRWKWADPAKEVAASREEQAGLMKSVSSTIREQGGVPEDVFEEISEEREKWAELGIAPTEKPAENTNETEGGDDAGTENKADA